jgi:hypothetical protein
MVVRGKQNWIEGNYIGTDATGTSAAPNVRGRQWRAGIWLSSEATGNTIGTDADGTADVEEANLISGNSGHGISIAGGVDNLIAGNRIGVDAAGSRALANAASGIMIQDGRDNTVGGTHAAAGNIIGSNERDGVSIMGENASGNRVLGNHIGTDRKGTADLGQGLQGVGIHKGAHHNCVGGFAAGAGNTIAFNEGMSSSLLTVDHRGAATRVTGTLNVSPDSHVTLDFYAQPSPIVPPFSDAKRYLGSAVTTSAGNGVAPVDVTLRALTGPMETLSVTASDGHANRYEIAFDRSSPGFARAPRAESRDD